MTPNTKLAALIVACLATTPLMAIAADANFPRQDDPGSIDHVVDAAMNSVVIAKRALVDYGVYDQNEDPAKWLIMQIGGRGYNMQREGANKLDPMYSMRFIMDRVRRMEDQVVSTFKEKRAIHCIATEDNGYEAAPGTEYGEASMYCLTRPDWKRYEVDPGAAAFETEVGSTAQ